MMLVQSDSGYRISSARMPFWALPLPLSYPENVLILMYRCLWSLLLVPCSPSWQLMWLFQMPLACRQLLSSYLPLKRSEICFRISDILRSSSVTGSFSGRSFGVGPSLAGLADAARCV